MGTSESHALDGLLGYIREIVTAKTGEHGLDDATVRRMAEAGLFERNNFRMTLRLLDRILSFFSLDQTKSVINADPLNMLRPIKRLKSHIKDLVTELAIRREDALKILAKRFDVLELTGSDFNSKCRAIAAMIPDSNQRREFILAYPECFLIPYVQLLKRQGMRFTERSPEQIWDVLINDGDKKIELETYEPRKRGKKKTRRSSRPADEDPEIPPTEPPPPISDSWPEQENDLPEHVEETVAPEPSEPSTSNETNESHEFSGENDNEQDQSMHIPLPAVKPSPSAIELTEKTGIYARRVIKFLTTDAGAGIHWDIARPFVLHRPWLADPSLNCLQTLEILSELGIRGERLMDAMDHGGLFALGYYVLEPMLSELTENRTLPLPDDIRDLAIPRRIILRRIKALEKNEIEHSDLRFKSALYAPTEREFEERIS